MILTAAFYTIETVTINIVDATDSNLIPPGYLDAHPLTTSDILAREYGSKLVIVVEQCQCAVVWLCKACLAIMYLRITSGLPRQSLAVKLLAGYIAATYIFMEILYLGVWCRPFSNYWAVPTPNKQCNAATNHLITNTVFNLSSDAAMLAIGVPLFIRSQLPLKRKFILTGVFGLGLFNIVCCVMNKFYSFTEPYGDDWVFWYIREAATAVIVANLPFMWTLLRRVCGVKSWVSQTSAQRGKSDLDGTRMLQLRRSETTWQDGSMDGSKGAMTISSARRVTFSDDGIDDLDEINGAGGKSWWRLAQRQTDEEDAIAPAADSNNSLTHCTTAGSEIYKTVTISVTTGDTPTSPSSPTQYAPATRPTRRVMIRSHSYQSQPRNPQKSRRASEPLQARMAIQIVRGSSQRNGAGKLMEGLASGTPSSPPQADGSGDFDFNPTTTRSRSVALLARVDSRGTTRSATRSEVTEEDAVTGGGGGGGGRKGSWTKWWA